MSEKEKEAFAEGLIAFLLVSLLWGITLALRPSAFDTVLLISTFIFIISLGILLKTKRRIAFRYR